MAAAETGAGLRALLFDLDNTLIDTAGADRKAERQ
ncbi:hypothetical protein scyTo_0026693, partial [Scyliorhinus torazame]|nr:hypothetical protein [Scyliorhinus torazame]